MEGKSNFMKKEIFLSFKPDFFRPILYDIKKYEYRKRFCNDETTAYLYLSSPIQEVIGILELGVPIQMKEIITRFEKDSVTFKRITDCLNSGEKFAIPIISLQLFKRPISITELKELDSNFHVPRCYLNITKHTKILKFLREQEKYDIEFHNRHNEIYENNFGTTCREMEMTVEFKKKDIEYNQNPKYNIIKSKYLNKR